tara:strand:+ start:131 stop:379 length:249 start_codon:yes stop_codon:yes gene_type:complete
MEYPSLPSNLPTGQRTQPDEAVGNVQYSSGGKMNPKTRQLCETIRRKVKHPMKNGPMFKDNNEILELALENYYEILKKDRLV